MRKFSLKEDPKPLKAILKKQVEQRYGNFETTYKIELYIGSEYIKRIRCKDLEDARDILNQIKANPEDFFYDTKIIDQVIFSLPG